MVRKNKPRKELGQNFLTSVVAINTIVDTALEASKNYKDITILEVGPGRGALTKALLKKFRRVLAVEKDNDLFEELGGKFAKEIQNQNLTLFHGDILELTSQNLGLLGKNYAIVANIPYYITGQFLRNWLGGELQPKFMVLMLQKEVVRRIVANDKKESLLSISVKAYGEPKYIATVKAGSFYPVPKVDSAILLIDNISKSFYMDSQEKHFFALLKAGFAHKRKILIKNLEEATDGKQNLDHLFEKLEIPLKARAENLSVKEWGKLASGLSTKFQEK